MWCQPNARVCERCAPFWAGCVLFLVLLLIGLLTSCTPRPCAWEYKMLYSSQPAQTSRVLDSLGAEGWELTAASGSLLYLKRVTP